MDDNGGEWVQETVDGNSFWFYYDSNGDRVTGWIKSNGYWYYCYGDGTMAHDTMVDGYYVNDDGQWTKDEGSREIIDGNRDHFWYYVGTKGKAVTGWNKIGDTFHYYYYPDGSMARKDTINGSYSDSEEFYVDDDGNIASGTGWIKDEYSGKCYYYLEGSMQTGWVKGDDGTWYFLKSDGSMATGWQYINGFWYYLQSDGSMAANKWVNDGTGWYYLYKDGSMARGATANGYYVCQETGKMVTGAGWQHIDNKYFYLNGDDSVVTGWLKDKNIWYYFYPENSDSYYQGEMAEDTTIDGWNVGDDGGWDGESSNSQGTSDDGSTENSNRNTSSNSIIENVQKLEELAKEYYGTDDTYKINTGVMNVIRRKYNGLKWAVTAYPLDTGFIEYVRKNDDGLLNFFSDNGEGASLIDPKTGGEMDFLHFAATLNTEFTSHPGPGYVSAELSDLAGWAGDLQQSIGDLQKAQINSNIGDNVDDLTNSAKEIIGANVSSFSASDMLADVDARNIGVNLKSDSGLLLSKALQDYYSNGENSRYTTFVESYGGIDNLQKVVDGVTINARDPLTKDILNGNKISSISNNQLEALNRAFIEYLKNQTLNE